LGSRRITIRDVAEQAGVSQSTVSRVLSATPTQIPISEATRQRVHEVANALGYRPHPGARSLSGKSTGLLGVIVRELDDPFFAKLTEVVSNVAKEKGYDLVLGNAKRDPENALALRDRMLDLGYCDGLLLCGDLRESSEDHTFLARMGDHHPVVAVACDSRLLACNLPSVGVDNRKGTWLALDHLIELGHRRIACLDAGRGGDLWARLEAYGQIMQERFGGAPQAYVQRADNSCRGGYEAAKRLLALDAPPSAVFAMDDMMAIGALSAARDSGWAVPGDLSIVGFDDMDASAYVRPALTTLRQPMQEIGQQAVQLLLQVIDGEVHAGSWPRYALEPQLIVRDSSGPGPDA
jgi:LacI family repressor for deo operon, udp, cdd, tsx, nupC, and nupG